ncbi:MAG TPA: hypothetical protein VKV15_20615 [Bryobacteraceae bacterium]|nr:hypothetical protein [Bryobacteraceae bacterium]
MLVAFLLIAAIPDWVPARWMSGDPKTLDLITQTPINCVLLEKTSWSEVFAQQAAKRGIATLGVIHPGGDPLEAARKAVSQKLSGVVLEGDFDSTSRDRVRKVLADSRITMVELTSRDRIRFDGDAPVIGTYQGLWPGVEDENAADAKSAPSGAPWIDTNTGFLRYAHASTNKPIWIANQPPPKANLNVTRYLQAIGDAAMTGAHWVVALDPDFNQRLLAGDPAALKDWLRIGQNLRFYEEHKDWRAARPHSQLALVEDASSGALLSGGILDMIAVKHTPVLPVPVPKLHSDSMRDAKMAVNVDPGSLNDHQKEILKAFTRAGGTLLTGPPGWKFPEAKPGQITLEKADLDKLDEIWKELNSMTGRKNLGARLFNVSTMLSNLLESPDGKQVILQLVNYSDYPVENITVHLLGKFQHARLYRPEAAPKDLSPYEVEDGTGVDVDNMSALATLVLE